MESSISAIEHEWDKRGYYRVGDKKYYSKVQAILNQGNHYPEFVFNDTAFAAADWAKEPTESLTEIYRQRALQLRAKYDHLVLCYSSGADSTTVLHSFIYNNIPIDEIFCYGPFSTTQGQSGKVTKSAEYNYREIDLVAVPYLQRLAKTHKFKITMYDWSEDMTKSYKDADWVYTEVNARLSPSQVVRNRLHDSYAHLNLVDKGKRVGFIFGVDKPRVILKNGSYYLAFLDLVLQQSLGLGGIATGSDWDYDEYFYWTPDMPKLIIKQAHMLKNYFEKNPGLKHLVENSDQGVWKYSEEYFDVVKQIVYPTFNPAIFQTEKNRSLTFADNDSWFINNTGLEARKYWLAGVQELQRIIDPKWINQGDIARGFVGSWSKWHKIGI